MLLVPALFRQDDGVRWDTAESKSIPSIPGSPARDEREREREKVTMRSNR